jgi:hypothetical protein
VLSTQRTVFVPTSVPPSLALMKVKPDGIWSSITSIVTGIPAP